MIFIVYGYTYMLQNDNMYRKYIHKLHNNSYFWGGREENGIREK